VALCIKTLTLKKNSTSGIKPAGTEIESGELAINTSDGIIFSKLENGSIVEWDYTSVAVDPTVAILPDGGNGSFPVIDGGGGVYSGTSSNINDSESAIALFILNLNCELDWVVSSEATYDPLTISYNGSVLVQSSGETSGTLEIDVASNPGKQLKIEYSKDSSLTAGSDEATISNFRGV